MNYNRVPKKVHRPSAQPVAILADKRTQLCRACYCLSIPGDFCTSCGKKLVKETIH